MSFSPTQAPKVSEYECVYHTIEVDVAPDNAKPSLELPLAGYA